MVPDLDTVRFELDVRLLVYQPLDYITVTLDKRQIDTKEYTVDDLKDVIYSRLGQHRTAFWMALPSTGDSRVWEVPHTCTLEDLVLYFVNSRRVRPLGLATEYPRESVPFPYRPLHTVAPRLHDDVIGQLRLPLTAYHVPAIFQFSEWREAKPRTSMTWYFVLHVAAVTHDTPSLRPVRRSRS